MADCIPFISEKIIMFTPNPCDSGSTCSVVRSGGTTVTLGWPRPTTARCEIITPLGWPVVPEV